jgi:hypothetical protein
MLKKRLASFGLIPDPPKSPLGRRTLNWKGERDIVPVPAPIPISVPIPIPIPVPPSQGG